jgi:hypothetical protein
MKLIIREDGSGSQLDLFDVDIVVSIHDISLAGDIDPRHLPISGVVQGSIYRPMRFGNRLYSMHEWEGIAFAAWLHETSRRGMYADRMPDVGSSWTAKEGGVPITWPDWMHRSWFWDQTRASEILDEVVTQS